MIGKNESNDQVLLVHHVVVKGDGYINGYKIEKSKGKDKKNLIRIKLSLLHGKQERPVQEFYSLLVEGAQAHEVLRLIVEQINDNEKKVAATVILHKRASSPFIFETGKKVGQLGVTHFGSLIGLEKLSIDGKILFTSDNQLENGVH